MARQAALLAALEKAGVDKSEHYTTLEGSIREWRWYVPAVSAWLTRGEGSAKAAAKAVQKHLAEEAAASKERQEQARGRGWRGRRCAGAAVLHCAVPRCCGPSIQQRALPCAPSQGWN